MHRKRAMTVAVLTLASAAFLPARAAPVDGDILSFDGHYYAWIAEKATWSAAKLAAEGFVTTHDGQELTDWHLATITSQAENDFLSQVVLGLPWAWSEPNGAQRAWIGLYDQFGANNFKWVTGESTTYTHWEPGEPNNPGGSTVATLGRYPDGGWNDEYDNATNSGYGLVGSLIEQDGPSAPIPEPTAFAMMLCGLGAMAARLWRRH